MSPVSATVVRAGAHPAIVPQLVVSGAPLSLDDERELGTFEPSDTPDLIGEIADAGLRGRGGAGFPTARKLAAVRDAPGPRVIVANGGEGEPSSNKDRWLMAHRPHLIIDGVLRAAAAIGAGRAVIYVAESGSERSLKAALAVTDHVPGKLAVNVHVAPSRYVSGEESAVCRSINGGPALPTDKPPRPCQRGVDDLPTAVVNVETLAHASVIARIGAVAYRCHGTARSPGTTLVTLNGSCRTPGVYEVPFGLSLRDMFESVGGGFTATPTAFLVGGWFGGLLDAEGVDTTCSHEAMATLGTGVGCAAFTAIGADEDVPAMVAEIGDWFARESAQQCGVCVKGTAAIAEELARLARGEGDAETIGKLTRWGRSLRGRGACALLDGAATLARTVVVRPSSAMSTPPTEETRP